MYRLHREYERALERLANSDVTPAEAHRSLLPLEERLGVPRPSYATVRRFLIEERRLRALARKRREPFLEKLATGRIPQT